jgi:hypothetical protein
LFLDYTRFDIPVEDAVLPDAVFAGTFGSETAARASRIRADGVITLEGLALKVEGRRGSGRAKGAESLVGVGAGVAFTGGIGVGTLSTSTSSNSSSDNVEPVLEAKSDEGGSLSNEEVSFVEPNLGLVLV